MEKMWENNLDLTQIFVDFKEAYDCIDRTKLFEILIHFNIPIKLVKLIRLTMIQTTAKVKAQTGVTDPFSVTRGLKQGDGLAPTLFNIALEYVIRKLSVQGNTTLENKMVQLVGYADDINIMARSNARAKETYQELRDAAEGIGLQINTEKTKVMINTRRKLRKPNQFKIGPLDLEIVNQFKYLGCWITEDNDEIHEIKRRIHSANGVYASLSSIIKSRDIHRQAKATLYKVMIRPILTYGSETWTMSKQAANLIDTFERRILRRIYGPVQDNGVWRIRYNNELYNLYKDNKLTTIIRYHRLQWAGHIIRMGDNRIPKKVLFSQIEGRRPIGRPRDRWIDAVASDAKTLLQTKRWTSIAKERTRWRQTITEAMVRSRTATP